MENIAHEKTKDILKWFEEISKIPRCSKEEDKIVNYLIEWSKENGFEYKIDEVQNLIWNRYEKEFLHFLSQEQEQNHLRFILSQEQPPE